MNSTVFSIPLWLRKNDGEDELLVELDVVPLHVLGEVVVQLGAEELLAQETPELDIIIKAVMVAYYHYHY